jgi:dihydroxyacetone kinase-like protein
VLGAGVAAVKERGRSDAGDKTMLDVLVPVQRALAAAADRPPGQLVSAIRQAAAAGLESTRPLQARKGRASFLGERSIGHIDPGARSSALLVDAVCDVVEERAK